MRNFTFSENKNSTALLLLHIEKKKQNKTIYTGLIINIMSIIYIYLYGSMCIYIFINLNEFRTLNHLLF